MTKFFYTGLVVAAIVITLLFLGLSQHHADANTIVTTLRARCSDFATAGEVKAYVKAHPQERKRLDRDHDHKSCENIK